MLHRAQMSDFKHLPWVFRNSNRDRRCYARIREISLSSVSDTSKIKCSVLRLITILDPLEVDDKILVSSWRDLFVRMKFCEENFKRNIKKKKKKRKKLREEESGEIYPSCWTNVHRGYCFRRLRLRRKAEGRWSSEPKAPTLLMEIIHCDRNAIRIVTAGESS